MSPSSVKSLMSPATALSGLSVTTTQVVGLFFVCLHCCRCTALKEGRLLRRASEDTQRRVTWQYRPKVDAAKVTRGFSIPR